jgi:hypothetical protein
VRPASIRPRVARNDNGLNTAARDAKAGPRLRGSVTPSSSSRKVAPDIAQNIVQRNCLLDVGGQRDDTLMLDLSRSAAQARGVGRDDSDTGFRSTLLQLDHARIAPARIDIDGLDRIRRMPQAGADRVETGKHPARRHP